MASQLPNFTLELHGDMKANWDYFCETFESYVTLMGYRPKHTAKEMAALKYALPKEARAVLKNSIKWEQGEDQQDPALTLKKVGNYYAVPSTITCLFLVILYCDVTSCNCLKKVDLS